ncbi:hypothetical protein F2Q70_00005349 [Brassica cretica]|uniref:Uncharacterized protein n=1 Tax=Brassica cretica TaxID=69181 RepID=A0A8S9G302_BRACR|nr:hypothetical protein F2Q68_00021979 [Brassica cretica]KAF2574995.1 hypothetical protein F2Q70_00005349 [Brassica cretica]
MYADEAESSYCNAEPVQYSPQPEADDGIPMTCYCCAEPVVGCSYTPKDPYRRQLKDQGNESEQKLLNLEKTVYELSKKKSGVKLMVCLLVLIGIVAKASKESGVPREFL